MDADELRKLPVNPGNVSRNWGSPDDQRQVIQLELLREIAAQLAEVSFHLSDLCYKADVLLRRWGPVK